MSSRAKKTPAEELLESLLSDLSQSSHENDFSSEYKDDDNEDTYANTSNINLDQAKEEDSYGDLEGLFLENNIKTPPFPQAEPLSVAQVESVEEIHQLEDMSPVIPEQDDVVFSIFDNPSISPEISPAIVKNEAESHQETQFHPFKPSIEENSLSTPNNIFSSVSDNASQSDGKTVALSLVESSIKQKEQNFDASVFEKSIKKFQDQESTIAVTGFQIKSDDPIEDKVKISVGKQSRSNGPSAGYSSGYSSWGSETENQLGQAENLRIAQEKILQLESENTQLRRHNEELMSATDIIKERSDLLTAQLTEFKNDRDGLEQSFKNEMTLLKNHLSRKDAELKKSQFKVDELESRLKFDMKRIRVRERELENRLELVRAEKNAVAKNKDEQILDLRRKIDILQMEVDSYRQKCVELNKQIESSQDSFKRTTRALRLAMANLELQEENKINIKKVD